jgi:hypothetical protein
MLEEARKLAARSGLGNGAWHRGDVYALPFGGGAFDIVSCRYAFHHLLEPARAAFDVVAVERNDYFPERARFADLPLVEEIFELDSDHSLALLDEAEKIDLLQRTRVFVLTPVQASDGGFETVTAAPP